MGEQSGRSHGPHPAHTRRQLTRAVSGTRSSFMRRLVQSRASSSSAISCRWNTATWADVRRIRPLGVRSTPSRSSASGALSVGSSGGCRAGKHSGQHEPQRQNSQRWRVRVGIRCRPHAAPEGAGTQGAYTQCWHGTGNLRKDGAPGSQVPTLLPSGSQVTLREGWGSHLPCGTQERVARAT